MINVGEIKMPYYYRNVQRYVKTTVQSLAIVVFLHLARGKVEVSVKRRAGEQRNKYWSA